MFALVIFGLLTLFAATTNTEPTGKVLSRCSRWKHDIFIVIDGSRNVGNQEFNAMKRFLQKFVSKLDIGLGKTHIGLLLVNDRARTKIEISLGQYNSSKALSAAVGRIRRHGRKHQDMGYAFELVQKEVFTGKEGDRPDVHDVLILFTERIAAIQLEDVLKKAEVLRSQKVEIITVAFKTKKLSWSFKDELTAIASIPRNVLTFQLHRLKKLKRTLGRRICWSKRALHPAKGCTRSNHDVFFLLDGSGSISLAYFKKMKNFLTNLIENLDVGPRGTHVGLLQFSHRLRTKIEFQLGEYQTFKEVKAAIERMPYQKGGTETGDALAIVNEKVFSQGGMYRPNVSDLVVILTDGEARDRLKALDESAKLRQKGVKIIAIGMGDEKTVATFRHDLQLMATKTSDVFTADFKKLPYLVKALTSKICYGRRPRATKCAHQKRDILFLVDDSASVTIPNMNKVKKFLRKLVLELNIGKRRNHIGLVQFSETHKTRQQFRLDQYYDPQRVGRAISKMKYHAGLKTMIGYALNITNKILNGRHGDRPDTSDVVILVADGGAHDRVEARQNAVKLKRRGVKIVTVYIPNSNDNTNGRKLLRGIASSRSDFYTSDFDNLKYIAADLVKVVCSDGLGPSAIP